MNNAGVFAEDHIITSEGLELTFAVNVVAPFIVTSLVLPLLLRQKSRIVIASSISQSSSIRDWKDMSYSRRPYSAHTAYSESKLLDAVLTMEMANRFQQASIGTDRITCNCLDPGTVNTKMLLSGWGPCGIDVEDALDETWLCTSDEVETVTGRYFVHRSDRRAAQAAYEKGARDSLWSMLCDLSPEAARMWNFDPANEV
jgi:NAD(P)-dependent dehydrogenase (short-subunit alcohol dehydrogenase family)